MREFFFTCLSFKKCNIGDHLLASSIKPRQKPRSRWRILAVCFALLVIAYLVRAIHTPGQSIGYDDRAIVMIGLLAAATLVSEDLTCVGAGILVAQGRISFLLGAFACFFGIFVGDVLLFLAG